MSSQIETEPRAVPIATLSLVAVDVDYRDGGASAAGVWFADWPDAAAGFEAATWVAGVADYEPGAFTKRELPCLLAVLALGPPASVVVVDGYVTLGGTWPGLGANLAAALGPGVAVIGVAKTRFAGADALPVCRGASRSPLFVSATGVDAAAAAAWVRAMHGEYRVPTLLRRVDTLARTSTLAGT